MTNTAHVPTLLITRLEVDTAASFFQWRGYFLVRGTQRREWEQERETRMIPLLKFFLFFLITWPNSTFQGLFE